MSVDEKNENLFFSGEIENDGDVDVTPIAESMKSFGKHTSGTEEMEIYEDTNTDSMEFIHREGNRGVVSDLEFLPEDDDVEGDTRIFSPGDLQSVSDAADAGYAAAGAEAESGVSSGTDIMANEALLSEYGLLTEDPVLDIPEVSEEYVPDEIVMTEEEAEELGDLTYHDEDVSEIRRKEAARRRREEGRRSREEHERHSGERERHSGERERHSGEHERKSGERERRAGEHERHSESRGEHRGEHHKSGSEQRSVHKPQHAQGTPAENAGKSAEHHKGTAQHNGQAHKSQHAQSDAGRSANHSAKPSGKPSGSHGERPAQGHGGNGGHGGRPGRKKKKEFSLFDGALIFGAVAAIFLVVILAVVALNKSNNMKKAETVAMLGMKLAALETIGGSGIDDIVANRKTTVIESVTEETVSSGKVGKDVSVNFTSIEKDLKIKFIDKSTNALIKGVAFKVEAKTPSNKQVTWEDSDKDGMIYKEDIESGIYKVKIVSVGDYVFPDEESEVTVKDKISYVAINVVDEIKKENEINLAIEEPKGAEIDTGTQLQDTVAWVGSSQKESYVEINKANDLPNIATLAMASKRSMSCAAPASAEISGDSTVEVGKTITLSAKVKMDDDTEKAPDETTWSSSDSEVATVSGSGAVEGKKAGTVTITCVCAVM